MAEDSATHETLRRRHEVRGSSDRAFGVVFTIVFVVIGLWPLIAGGDAGARLNGWWLGGGAVILTVALVRPGMLGPANRLWLNVGLLLHRVVNPVVMAAMFYIVLTPLAVVMRLAGRDSMHRTFDRETASYWIAREPGPAPETMKNQF